MRPICEIPTPLPVFSFFVCVRHSPPIRLSRRHTSLSTIHQETIVSSCCSTLWYDFPNLNTRLEIMNTGASPFGNAHKDVLEAPIPDSDEGKARLLEELKNRGRSAVQAGQWPDAQLLYKKALECCSPTVSFTASEQNKTAAILHANLALVQGKMNHWKESEEHGTQATALDPSYTKGWWRLGQAQSALKKYSKAVEALKQAQKLEPNNKALNKELASLEEKAVKAAKEAEEAAAKQAETTEPMETTPPPTKTTSSAAKTSKPKTNTAEPMQVETDGDTSFTKSEHVKGYKIVNGKKTSYFHNELSEEAAKLIGDIAPKKLSANDQPASTSTNGADGTSAWNKAGTWEEKDVSTWAIDSLQARLMAVSYTFPASSPAPDAIVRTRKATVSGHASVATVRGKKRYIYELILKLEWEFEDSANGHDAHGILNFPDFDGTCEVGEPYEATNFEIQHSDQSQTRPLLEAFVHKQGWREVIHACMDDWVRYFKETY